MKFSGIYLLLISTLFLSSCKGTKMLEALSLHEMNIARAVSDDVSPKEKLDIVGETFVSVLQESLSFGPVKKSSKHISSFTKTNEKNLDIIFEDISKWIGGKSKREKQMFLLGLATKPYTRELIATIPKVERKISRKIATYRFFGKLLSFVKI